MADLSGSSEDLDKFIEAVRKATSSLNDGTNLADELRSEEKDSTRAVIKEFDNLGFSLKDHDKVVDKDTASLKERAKNEKLVNDQLIASGKIRADATKEEIEAYKLTQQQNTAYREQLSAMGRYIDESGKIIDTTVRLNKSQLLSLAQESKKNEEHQKLIKGAAAVTQGFADFRKGLAAQAVSSAFQLLTASIMGTYKGMLALEDALLAGQEGHAVRAAALAVELEELAGALKSSGEGFINLSSQTAAAAISMAAVSLPMAALALAIAGVTFLFGLFQKAEALNLELQAKRVKQQAELLDKVYEGYKKLAASSMIGSRGLQGLYDDLHKMGLTVNQFEKLNKVLQANQKEIGLFGAGMVDGAKNFSTKAAALLKDELGVQLEAMGIGQEEQFAHMANFMAQQAKFGQKTNGDITKSAASYIKELDKLAVITGASRKEQEDARKAILSMNELRAAILNAEMKGDTKRQEILQRAMELSAALHAKGLKEEGGAVAKYYAGGASDAETARIKQSMGGQGGALDMVETGKSSLIEMTKAAVEGLRDTEKRFSSTTQITGPIAGLTTNNLAALMDFEKGLVNATEGAKKAGKSLDEFAAAERKAAADAIADTELRRKNRDKALALDDKIKAGGSASEASNTIVDIMWAKIKAWWEIYKPGGTDDQEMYAATKKTFEEIWEGTKKMTSELGSAFSKAYDSGKETLSNLANSMIPILSKIGDQVRTAFEGMIDKIIESVKTLIKMIPSVSDTVDAVKGVAASTAGAARGVAASASEAATGAASSISGAASSAWGGIKNAIGGGGAAPAAPPSAPPPAAPAANARANFAANDPRRAAMGATSAKPSPQPPEGSENNAAAPPKSINLAKILKFGSNSGSQENFEGLDSTFKNAVIAAATEYNSVTGNMIMINSAKRDPADQQRLYDDWVARGKTGMPVGKPGRSLHEKGQAVDIQNYKDSAAIAAFNKQGLSQKVPNDPVHFQARYGGIANGPSSGYPATLHGNEIVSPLSPNSILEHLGKTSVSSGTNSIINSSSNSSTTNNNNDILNGLFDMMVSKLDTVIDKLDSGNDISKKIVKAMA